jgi:anti-sigma B factor antagonist
LPYLPNSVNIDRHDNGRVVVAVSGEVDLATAPQLRSALEGALHDSTGALWLDLCRTTFMDSSGLRVLFDVYGQAEQLERQMTIACPAGPVRRLFELTGYDRRLPLRERLEPER